LTTYADIVGELGKGKKRAHPEAAAQEMFVEWAALIRTPLGMLINFVVAIPNGAHLAGDEKQRSVHMAHLQKQGLRPGASDLFIAYPCGGYHGLWIEMKRPRRDFRTPEDAERAVTEEQVKFMAYMRQAGYRTAIAFGFDEATLHTDMYLKGI
jgi:hypothetical protein